MISIELPKRKTEYRVVTVFCVNVLFSYSTAVAFSWTGTGEHGKREFISRTTVKHLSEAGFSGCTELDESEFEEQLASVLTRAALVCVPTGALLTAYGKRVGDMLVPKQLEVA